MKKYFAFFFFVIVLACSTRTVIGQTCCPQITKSQVVQLSQNQWIAKIWYVNATTSTGSISVGCAQNCFDTCFRAYPTGNDTVFVTIGPITCGSSPSIIGKTYSNNHCGGTPCNTLHLPIKFLSFSATKDRYDIILEWSVATENLQPGQSFRIERSFDGSNFHSIDTIPVIDGKNTYRYRTHTETTGSYYRISFGDQYTYDCTDIKFIKFDEMKISYQLTSDHMIFVYILTDQSKIELSLFNMQGSLISKSAGKKEIAIPSAAAKGIYVLMLRSTDRGTIWTTKLVL